ncbi:MAG: hypothetical protein ACR2KQ_05090 [Actinomycetota bacterium]
MTEPEGLDGQQPVISRPLNFTALVASAGRLYSRNARRLMPLFAGIGLFISILPVFFFFDLPEGAIIPIYLFVQVAVPAVLAGLGIAVASAVMEAELNGRPATVRAGISWIRGHFREILAAALLGGMLAIFVAVFLGILSFMLIYLFFGPPIVIQVVALERARLQAAWPRTKELMKGHWLRVFMYLFTIGLGIALMQSLALALTNGAIQELARPGRAVLVNLANLMVIAVAMPYLAAASFALYKDLVWRREQVNGPDATQD